MEIFLGTHSQRPPQHTHSKMKTPEIKKKFCKLNLLNFHHLLRLKGNKPKLENNTELQKDNQSNNGKPS